MFWEQKRLFLKKMDENEFLHAMKDCLFSSVFEGLYCINRSTDG